MIIEILFQGKKTKAGRKRREDWESIPCTICDYKARNNHFLDKHTFEEHESSRLCTQVLKWQDDYRKAFV